MAEIGDRGSWSGEGDGLWPVGWARERLESRIYAVFGMEHRAESRECWSSGVGGPLHPEGMRAISRWLSEGQATPPVA